MKALLLVDLQNDFTPSGRPARSSSLSIISLKAFISARTFLPKFTDARDNLFVISFTLLIGNQKKIRKERIY